MTAKQLHELTAPLFAKHPSAKPVVFSLEDLREHELHKEDFQVHWRWSFIPPDAAALIIQGHLVEWLAQDDAPIMEVASHHCRVELFDGRAFEAETLIEAIIAACMEIE